MTIKTILSSAILSILLTAMPFFVFGGDSDGGGGDTCEAKFYEIRNDISYWITNGGHLNLELSDAPAQTYAALITEAIHLAKVKCVGVNDLEYPVEVNGIPKVCKYQLNNNEAQITCDASKFYDLSEENKYILVHHEYAGIAGLEKPDGATSDYAISNQLVSFLEDRLVKRLTASPVLYRNDLHRCVSEISDKTTIGDEVVVSLCKQDSSFEYVSCVKKLDDLTYIEDTLIGNLCLQNKSPEFVGCIEDYTTATTIEHASVANRCLIGEL